MADLTKAQTLMQSNEWENIDDTGTSTPYWESNELTLTDDVGAVIHIDLCHLDGNAVTAGSEPDVIVWVKSGSGDDDWHELVRYTGTGGTADMQELSEKCTSGQASVHLDDSSEFEVNGSLFFLNDNDGLANSEIICLAYVADSSAPGEIVAMDNLSHTFSTVDDIINIVDQWNVRIPKEIQAARVTVHTKDADATFAVRCVASTASDIV